VAVVSVLRVVVPQSTGQGPARGVQAVDERATKIGTTIVDDGKPATSYTLGDMQGWKDR
jgi:hypothetical protein